MTCLFIVTAALIVTACVLTSTLFYLEWKEDYISKHNAGRTGV